MARLGPLRVLSPCEVPAAELQPSDAGAYCKRCETPVHDLTSVSEAHARALGLLNGSRFCGRIRIDASGRGVFGSEARTLQALGLAAVVATAACSSVEPSHPLPTEPSTSTEAPSPRASESAVPSAAASTAASAEPTAGGRRVIIGETMGMMILQQVQFAPQSSVPPPETRAILDETAKILLANPDQIPLLQVEGHADAKERQPDALSKRRAEEVVEYLVAKGVPRERLVAAGEGSKKPIDDNATAEGRARNRRIELHVVR